MPRLDRFARQVAASLASQAGATVIGMGTGVVIARFLGPEGKGMFTLALLAPGILQLVLNGGLASANVYYTGSRRLSPGVIMAQALLYTGAATVLAGCAAFALHAHGLPALAFPGVPEKALLAACLVFPAGLLSGYFLAILRGRMRLGSVNAVEVLASLLTLCFALLFMAGAGMGLMGAVFAHVLARSAVAALAVRLAWKEAGPPGPWRDRAALRALLGYGFKAWTTNFLQFFNYRLDFLVVNFFLGPAGTGIYSISSRMAELLWRFPSAAGFVLLPSAARKGPDHEGLVRRAFKANLAITLAGAVFLALAGRPAIVLFYSSSFSGAYLPMLLLLPGVALSGAGRVLTTDLAGRGLPQYDTICSGVALAATLILDFALIPRHGLAGAAEASTAAYTLHAFLAFYFHAKEKRRRAAGGNHSADVPQETILPGP